MTPDTAIRNSLKAQFIHWSLALERLAQLDDIASTGGWLALERHTGVLLRATLKKAVDRLITDTAAIGQRFERLPLPEATRVVQQLRRDYLRMETMLDFFADAINTRTSHRVAGLLAAADALAMHSMQRLLNPLRVSVPPVVSYIDKGLGASILKAGLRLWDRNSINPVAMIKVVRHNILRPTALLHEAGHQVAHIVSWNEQLRAALANHLPGNVAEMWSSWSSEIAADAFAFVNTGYASVAALRNVVDGGARMVYRYLPGDPHPIAYLRVLLGVAMCRQFYGAGPWDELARVWNYQYPLKRAPSDLRSVITDSVELLPRIAKVTLRKPYPAFDGRALAQRIDPNHVSPAALRQFEHANGARLYNSPYLAQRESLRLLALSGYRFATQPDQGASIMNNQLSSMLLLGRTQLAA